MKTFSLGLLSFALAQSVLAAGTVDVDVEQEPAAAASTSIETVQVWATQVKSSSVFLGENQIATKQADHLSELMRDIPGVDIGGTHSVNQRINIRGLDDRNLNVTIDGAKQTNYMFHHMGNLLINPDILRSVDIDVGANSVLTGALGGAVRFETKSAQDLLQGERFGSRVQLGYNSNASLSGSFTAYGQLSDSVDLLAYVNQNDRDNFEDGDGTEILGNDGVQNNGLVKAGWNINQDHRLTLSFDKYQDKGDYTPRPDMGVATNAAISGATLYPTEFGRETWNLGYQGELQNELMLSANLYSNSYDLERDNLSVITEGSAENTGVTFLTQLPFSAGVEHLLSAGLESNTYTTEYITGGVRLGGEEQRLDAIYIQDRLSLTDTFFVTPGVRYDQVTMDAVSVEEDFSDTSFALAAEWFVTDSWQLLASSTEVFKAPELTEVLVGAGYGKTPNPALKPETARNDQVGVRFSQDNFLGADEFTTGFNLFQTEIENYISYSSLQDVNLGDVGITGGEFSANYQLEEFTALFTFARSRSDTHDTSATNSLDREVGDSFGLAFSYRLADVDLSWNSQWHAEEKTQEKPAYDVHNFSAQWQPAAIQGLALIAGVDNVFNEQYTSHASRVGDTVHPVFGELILNDYEPGRNFKLTASYEF
ncbi:TonB-dependent receptor [Simiduia curdlanivorans]|uniref:TonB-dependent receptor domain-containing protein n=1 Tax=Simiduia curdlanivorans TaxID=1492769 RepID=A0ABV8V2B6_9GAMM|nr:TonB-dependent receptor [Simiduia curdlanivorans]MDN3637333.1 TonB-dependent receptor [Simiduia curdlanivorans]